MYTYKLNLIAIVGIVMAVSLVLGMASPAAIAFGQDNMIMTMDDNVSSMGNMTMGGNATSMVGKMTETESLPSAGQNGLDYCKPPYCEGVDDELQSAARAN